MVFLTTTIANQVIAALPAAFDSHAFIREAMTQAPNEYVQELTQFLGQSDSIQAAHAAIGRWLRTIPSIRPAGKVISTNIRGKDTANELWHKVAVLQVIPPTNVQDVATVR